MIFEFKKLYEKWSEIGLRFPFARDPVTKQPSVTLLIFYVMFVIMLISLVLLHFYTGMVFATATTILVWALSYVMYRIRHLDKFKINLQESELEFHSSDDEKKPVRKRKK